MLYIAADPGSKGALFTIQGEDVNHIDFDKCSDNDILHFLLLAKLDCDEYLCGLEHVGARPEDGVVQAFTFGRHFQRIITLFNIADVEHKLIKPQTWQNYMAWGRLPKGKENYKARKKELHNIAKELTNYKGVTLENADAFLIAKYLEITSPKHKC